MANTQPFPEDLSAPLPGDQVEVEDGVFVVGDDAQAMPSEAEEQAEARAQLARATAAPDPEAQAEAARLAAQYDAAAAQATAQANAEEARARAAQQELAALRAAVAERELGEEEVAGRRWLKQALVSVLPEVVPQLPTGTLFAHPDVGGMAQAQAVREEALLARQWIHKTFSDPGQRATAERELAPTLVRERFRTGRSKTFEEIFHGVRDTLRSYAAAFGVQVAPTPAPAPPRPAPSLDPHAARLMGYGGTTDEPTEQPALTPEAARLMGFGG